MTALELIEEKDPVSVGEVIDGRLRIERIIGIGAVGLVAEATHLELKERVALKFLRPSSRSREEQIGRFAREARAAVRLRGEHVARVFDVGALPSGEPYMVMELLEGLDLEQYLERRGPVLNVATASLYIIQACEALAEAHALDIVHRDIKPANLFLFERPGALPKIKLLDFGISKAALTGEYTDVALANTHTTTIMGTPYYMAPEQVRSTKDVDRRADIWALGAVLYELLTGRTMWRSEDLGALVQEILSGQPIPVLEARPELGAEFAAVLDRAIEPDLDRRYATAAEFARALLPFAPPTALVHVERAERFAANTAPTVARLRTGARRDSGGAASTADLQAAVAAEQAQRRGSRVLMGAVLVSLLIIGGAAAAVLVPRLGARPQEAPAPSAMAPSHPSAHATALARPHEDEVLSPIEPGIPTTTITPSARPIEPVAVPHRSGPRPPASAATTKLVDPVLAPTMAPDSPLPTPSPKPPPPKAGEMDSNPWQKTAKPKLDDPFAK